MALYHRADLNTLWLLGDPVHHSKSPLIQNTALQILEFPALYLAAPVRVEHFAQVVESLPHLGAIGANVTVPHKQRAFELCDGVSSRAQKMKAVNTLHFREGKIFGDNTDGIGWYSSLCEFCSVEDFDRAFIIGAGGAARAIGHTLVEAGMSEIRVFNRSQENGKALAQELGTGSFEVSVCELSSFEEQLRPKTLVVQTTSVGLQDDQSPLHPLQNWPSGCFLSELIYGKETELMRQVSALGGRCKDGLGMLCGQAAHSLALWLDLPFEAIPLKAMQEVAAPRG